MCNESVVMTSFFGPCQLMLMIYLLPVVRSPDNLVGFYSTQLAYHKLMLNFLEINLS